MKQLHKNILFGVITTLVLLLIVELLLRAAYNFSSEYLARRENINHEYRLWQMQLFDSFQGMNESDPDLFWRLKPNYRSNFISVNSLGYAGREIEPKQPNEFRILFLGDSTPLGIGIRNSNQSFVHRLEDLMKKRVPDRPVTVINASVAGYSSWQCRKQLELKGDELDPDLVITYFGNNDPSVNGYVSDRQLYERTRSTTWLNRFLGHAYLYQALKGLVLNLKAEATPTGKLLPRVSVEGAQDNIHAISDWCLAHHCELILCTVATPDFWPPGIQFQVFTDGKDSGGRLLMADELQSRLNEDWELCLDTAKLPGQTDEWTRFVYSFAAKDSAAASLTVDDYYHLSAQHPNDPRILNNLGVALWRQGLDPDSQFMAAIALDSLQPAPYYNLGIAESGNMSMVAESQLKHAKELDNFSLRIKPAYNNSYRRFCERNAATLADIEVLFSEVSEKEYFVDHCHPTFRGHELIAGELANIVGKHVK